MLHSPGCGGQPQIRPKYRMNSQSSEWSLKPKPINSHSEQEMSGSVPISINLSPHGAGVPFRHNEHEVRASFCCSVGSCSCEFSTLSSVALLTRSEGIGGHPHTSPTSICADMHCSESSWLVLLRNDSKASQSSNVSAPNPPRKSEAG